MKRLRLLIILFFLCGSLIVLFHYRYKKTPLILRYDFYGTYGSDKPMYYLTIITEQTKDSVKYLKLVGSIQNYKKDIPFQELLKKGIEFNDCIKTKQIYKSSLSEKVVMGRCIHIGKKIGDYPIMKCDFTDTIFCDCPETPIYFKYIKDTLINNFKFKYCTSYNFTDENISVLIDNETNIMLEWWVVFNENSVKKQMRKLINVSTVSKSLFDSLYNRAEVKEEFLIFDTD